MSADRHRGSQPEPRPEREDAPGFQLEVTDSPGFLRFRVLGVQDLRTDSEIDAAIARECTERGATAVLIDIRELSGRLSVIENHLAARTFRQRMPLSIARIAIIDLQEYRPQSDMYELTASNWGTDLRFFERIEDAESWLRSE